MSVPILGRSLDSRLLRPAPAPQVAIGGPASRADRAATPLVGATRYHTAIVVAQRFFTQPRAVGVARAFEFPDALTGGAHIGRLRRPIVLTASNSLPGVVRDYLVANRGSIESAFFYGGRAAISENVEQAVLQAIR